MRINYCCFQTYDVSLVFSVSINVFTLKLQFGSKIDRSILTSEEILLVNIKILSGALQNELSLGKTPTCQYCSAANEITNSCSSSTKYYSEPLNR